MRIILQPIRSNLHQSPIFRTAPGTAVQPQDCPLSIRNVPTLELPEEEVGIVFRIDFNVARKGKHQYLVVAFARDRTLRASSVAVRLVGLVKNEHNNQPRSPRLVKQIQIGRAKAASNRGGFGSNHAVSAIVSTLRAT